MSFQVVDDAYRQILDYFGASFTDHFFVAKVPTFSMILVELMAIVVVSGLEPLAGD